jgi:hypothetical protein
MALHHEGTKVTKGTKNSKHKNNSLLVAPCWMLSVPRMPFVSFVPSFCSSASDADQSRPCLPLFRSHGWR